MEEPYSAGAIISNVEDLYKWSIALFSGKIISLPTLTKMTYPHIKTYWGGYYGYGLFVDTFYNHPQIKHGGDINGFTSYLSHFPLDNTDVLVLSNDENSFKERIANSLSAITFDIPVIAPYKHMAVAVDSSVLYRYSGEYRILKYHRIDTLKVKAGKLFLHPQDQNQEIELLPESDTKFYLATYPDGYQFEFEVDNKARTIKEYLIVEGIKNELIKLLK